MMDLRDRKLSYPKHEKVDLRMEIVTQKLKGRKKGSEKGRNRDGESGRGEEEKGTEEGKIKGSLFYTTSVEYCEYFMYNIYSHLC